MLFKTHSAACYFVDKSLQDILYPCRKNTMKILLTFLLSLGLSFVHAQSKAEKHLEKARAHFAEMELEPARKEADKAIAKDPSLAEAYYIRGMSYMFDGPALGTEDFEKAISLDPKMADAWAQRAGNKNWNGDYEGALADYTRAIELDPENGGYYFNRAGIYDELERYDLSVRDWNMALVKGWDEFMCLPGRAQAKLGLKDYKGAMADINKAIGMDSSDPWMLIIRGKIYLGMGDTKKACEDFNTAKINDDMGLAGEYLDKVISESCGK